MKRLRFEDCFNLNFLCIPQYSFVTPLTSMVVTKPEKPDRNFGEIEDADEQNEEERHHSSMSMPPCVCVHACVCVRACVFTCLFMHILTRALAVDEKTPIRPNNLAYGI